MTSRREVLHGLGSTLLCASAAQSSDGDTISDAGTQEASLPLSEYEPRSMLHVSETHIPRARYPVIDIHTHLSWSLESENGVSLADERTFLASPSELLPVMERKNLRALVNLTGGAGEGLEDAIAKYDKIHPGRFYTFTEPSYNRFLEPAYPKLQADAIAHAHAVGARGLKILKTLGLFLRANITSGQLVRVDDPRFDPMWEACGQLNMPVAMHISDPVAFFLPTDRFNERYEELHNHPDWSFYGNDYPSKADLLEARNRVIGRHPNTQFIILHVGNFAENLDNVSEALDRFANMTVDIAARIGELGRQPRATRKFFDKYQDRILFGTDATPHGKDVPQQYFGDLLYEIYFRFLESEDEYFDYAPAKTPPQGRWRIYGLGLPDGILRKMYSENAARLLRIAV